MLHTSSMNVVDLFRVFLMCSYNETRGYDIIASVSNPCLKEIVRLRLIDKHFYVAIRISRLRIKGRHI